MPIIARQCYTELNILRIGKKQKQKKTKKQYFCKNMEIKFSVFENYQHFFYIFSGFFFYLFFIYVVSVCLLSCLCYVRSMFCLSMFCHEPEAHNPFVHKMLVMGFQTVNLLLGTKLIILTSYDVVY